MFKGRAEADASATYKFYLDDSSGIPFDQLARFSQPLLELFDVEPHHWRLPRRIPADIQLLDAYTSALAAAEMFWSYFTLDSGLRRKFLQELKSYFIGSEPLPHEEADFLLLVDCMRVQWQQIGGEIQIDDRPHQALSSENSLPDLETLALFGEPLMEARDLYDDPDRLDEIMTRVQDYWRLANTGVDHYDEMLNSIVDRHGTSHEDRRRVRAEASMMVVRHRELFST